MKKEKDEKMPEKVRIALAKHRMTNRKLAEHLDINEVTLGYKFRENFWRKPEIYFMKNELNFDLD